MSDSLPITAVCALAYFAAVIAVGVWAGRRTRTPRDFWIAGQRIGLWVTGLATASAAFSGFVFVGGPGLMYETGFASLFIVISVGFTSGLLCWVVAVPLRLLARERDVLTIPDAVFARYQSRLASGLAAAAILLGSTAYLGAQFLALGRVIEVVLGLESFLLAIAIGASVVLFYSLAGGMLAGVYTDVVQGGLMALVAVAVFHESLGAAGGLAAALDAIARSERFGPSFADPLGGLPALTGFGFFFVFSVGVLGQPHMLHKFYMLDEPGKLRFLPVVVGATQSLCLLVWLGIGLAVPALVAQGRLDPLTEPDRAAPLFLTTFASPLVAGLAFAAILAAVMSTADSFVNLAAAAAVRDLPRALGRKLDPARELFRGRAAVAVVAGLALALGYLYGDLVALLGTLAFGTFAATLAPSLAVGLHWPRVTARAAVASMATGLGATIVLELGPLPPGLLPAAAATAASFTVLFAVSWLERRS